MITVDFLINLDNEITNEWCLSGLPTSNTETTPAVEETGLILMQCIHKKLFGSQLKSG